MRTWMVIYKENEETKSRIITAKNFDDLVYSVWRYMASCDIKAIFEVV